MRCAIRWSKPRWRTDWHWIAYPKAGELGTDLNRDILWRHLLKRRIQGVRQIAIDDVWSALRFRREKVNR